MTKVAIIPGHGGIDSGATNKTYGTRECDGTLAVSLKLCEILKYNNIECVLSRTTDIACGNAKTTTQDVTNQINFVNNSGADIAIAIHYNGAINSTAHGVEVLYSNLLYPNPNEAKLAKILLEELVKTTKMTNRGLKTPDNISIIKKSKIPCVLSENGFVTNNEESFWCSDPIKQWLLAESHAKAICKYFNVSYKNYLKEEMLEMFKDIETNRWSAKSIERLVNLGILSGYSDSTFRPTQSLTREEFASALDKVLKLLGK